MGSTGLRYDWNRSEPAQNQGKPTDAACRFQLLRHLDGHGESSGQEVVDVADSMPRILRNLSDGEAVRFHQWSYINAASSDFHPRLPTTSVAKLHRSSSATPEKYSGGEYGSGMPRYKYRDAFAESHAALRETMTKEEIAKALGKSHHMVTSYMRHGDKASIPPEDVVRKLASLCRVSPFRFMDDPRLAEAIGTDHYSTLPQWQRDLLQLNMRTLDGSKLPPEQWMRLMDRLSADARAMEALFESANRKK